MARPLRIDVKGGWYHITSRGNAGNRIYVDKRDREHFLELLAEMTERFRISIHAYILMANHYHLIIQTPGANASQAMQWLNVSYSMWFNRRHGIQGHLFQGRFKGILVEGSGWACVLSYYVHLNPVRTKGLGLSKSQRKAEGIGISRAPTREEVKERLKVLRGYKWSSYRAYAGYEKAPGWLTVKELLRRAHREKSKRAGQYRKAVEDQIRQGVEESPWDKLKVSIVLGTEEFAGRMRRKLDRSLREHSGKKEMRSRVGFRDVVRQVEKIRGEKWENFRDRRRDWGKGLVLWAGRKFTGMTLAELGEATGGIDYATVAMRIRRFDQDAQKRKQLRQYQNRVREMLNVKI